MENVQVMVTDDEMNLVKRIARRVHSEYCPAGRAGQFTLEDLNHYGIVGLLEAKRNFQSDKGVPWLKFAAYRVRGAMIDQLRIAPIIRLPQEKQQKVKALESAKTALIQRGIEPDSESLAKELGWTTKEINKTMILAPKLVSAETDRKDSADEANIGSVILADERSGPEESFLSKELADVVNECLKRLATKDRMVFISRVLEGLRLREVAKSFSCSLESIRNWQDRAQKQMQACLEEHGWSLTV